MRSLQFQAAVLAVTILGMGSQPALGVSPIRFQEKAAASGITGSHFVPQGSNPNVEPSWMSAGVAAEDFDGDGYCDIYYLTGGHTPNALYINRGDGTFTDQAAAWNADMRERCFGANAVDIDGDGDIDISMTVLDGRHRFYESRENTVFQEVELVIPQLQGVTTSISWGDFNRDGMLDMVAGRWAGAGDNLYLYKQTAPWEFEVVELGDAPFNDYFVFTPRFADFTGNGFPDLAVTSDFGRSNFYVNLDGENFMRTTSMSNVGTDQNGMGSALGDYDNDGDIDWFIASIWDDSGGPYGNWGTTGNRLFRNNGDGTFTDATDDAGVRDGNWGWGSAFVDLDNDGHQDIFHVNGWSAPYSISYPRFGSEPARVFQNQGNGTFVDVAMEAGVGIPGQGRGIACADYDRDGDIDVFVGNNQVLTQVGGTIERSPGIPHYFRNISENVNKWLQVELDGVGAGQHPHGIGARLELTGSFGLQVREIHASSGYLGTDMGRIAHFGLGRGPGTLALRVRWPHGDWTIQPGVAPDQKVIVSGIHGTLSARRIQTGEIVTADGSAAPPAAGVREWIVDGQTYADPMDISFDTPGDKQLRLDVYDEAGANLLYSEILIVEVRDGAGAGGLMVY